MFSFVFSYVIIKGNKLSCDLILLLEAAKQLHPRCKLTSTPLRTFLPTYGKKWFSGSKMQCTFCKRIGHRNDFCPSRPYEPPLRHIIPFVEKLLLAPRVKTNRFIGLSLVEGANLVQELGESLNEGNPWAESTLIYDQLRAKLGFWKAIGASDAVISWLGYGVPMRFEKEPSYYAFPNHECEEEDMKAYVAKDFGENIASGCFILAPPGSVRVSNPILCIHQGCKCRRCDDCRHCNSYQANPSFAMDNVKRDVPNLVHPDEIQKTEDLEKAYYKVPVAKEASPFLGSYFMGRFYLAMIMLFGMCQAPFFFTKICRPIVRLFGALKTPALNYIDDWFWSVLEADLEGVSLFIRTLFRLLGWTFNAKGEEGTNVKFLGFIIDSVRRMFVVPAERAKAVSDALREFALASASHRAVERKLLERSMGSVISMSLAIPGVRLWCRSLYTHIYSTSSMVLLSKVAQKELEVLIFLITFCNGSPFLDPTHDISMWVDSGEIGWGASIAGVEVRGQFDSTLIGSSSTLRELTGLARALSHPRVVQVLTGRTVELNMDSMCSVRNLIKGGGPVPSLVEAIKEIWLICRRHDIHLLPVWLRRSEVMMVRVDELSKLNTFWALDDEFISSTLRLSGLKAWAPDLARCGPVLSAVITRKTSIALVLPQWEAKSWWDLAVDNCQSFEAAPPVHSLFKPNEAGLPQWDFFIFKFIF